MCQVSSSYSLLSRCLCLRVAFFHVIICISYHVIMCIALHTCSFLAFEHFPRCLFCIPAPRSPPVVFSTFLSCVGIKHVRIGPRLSKRPWFTTGRPPVKFRTIWTSFDTPTVNRGTEKASCVLQPNTPSIFAQNPPKPSPSSRAFDHDRVAENRTSFGLS